jgi:hypothetical protein
MLGGIKKGTVQYGCLDGPLQVDKGLLVEKLGVLFSVQFQHLALHFF